MCSSILYFFYQQYDNQLVVVSNYFSLCITVHTVVLIVPQLASVYVK